MYFVLTLQEQRLAVVQLEAHLLSQLTTLTKEYQGLMTHDQEQQKVVREYKQKLDKKQKGLYNELKMHSANKLCKSCMYANMATCIKRTTLFPSSFKAMAWGLVNKIYTEPW